MQKIGNLNRYSNIINFNHISTFHFCIFIHSYYSLYFNFLYYYFVNIFNFIKISLGKIIIQVLLY